MTLLPGSSTQPHSHPDIEESLYVLSGTGVAHWDGRNITVKPGSALCYPPNVHRYVTNTGGEPLTYVCHSASVDPTSEFEPLLEIAAEADIDDSEQVVERVGDMVIRDRVSSRMMPVNRPERLPGTRL